MTFGAASLPECSSTQYLTSFEIQYGSVPVSHPITVSFYPTGASSTLALNAISNPAAHKREFCQFGWQRRTTGRRRRAIRAVCQGAEDVRNLAREIQSGHWKHDGGGRESQADGTEGRDESTRGVVSRTEDVRSHHARCSPSAFRKLERELFLQRYVCVYVHHSDYTVDLTSIRHYCVALESPFIFLIIRRLGRYIQDCLTIRYSESSRNISKIAAIHMIHSS